MFCLFADGLTNQYPAALEEQHSQSNLNSYSILSTCIICSLFSEPQVIRTPGHGSADEREWLGLTQSNKVIKQVCCLYLPTEILSSIHLSLVSVK